MDILYWSKISANKVSVSQDLLSKHSTDFKLDWHQVGQCTSLSQKFEDCYDHQLQMSVPITQFVTYLV